MISFGSTLGGIVNSGGNPGPGLWLHTFLPQGNSVLQLTALCRMVKGKFTRKQLYRQAVKQFRGVHASKRNSPEVSEILAMQSMTPPIFTGKRGPGEEPYPIPRIRVTQLSSQTKRRSLLRSVMPSMRWETEYPPLKMVGLERCRESLEKRCCFMLQIGTYSSAEIERVRAELRQATVPMSVLFIKTTLLGRKLEGEKSDLLLRLARGPIALASADAEPSQLKQVWSVIQRQQQRMILLGGRIDGQEYGPTKCLELIQKIPSRAHMLATLCHLLEAPLHQLSSALVHPLGAFSRVLESRVEQLYQ